MEEAKTTYKDFLQPRDAWDALSMKEKAEMIGVAVRNGITNLNDIRDRYNEFAEGGDTNPYTVEATVDALYASNPKEEFLGEPSHHYDFTQSEEWANEHGYYPDARGHRDDRVKKPTHPSHPSRGTWNGDKFELTDLGMQNPNYTLFGLTDGGQDPQAVLTYQRGIVLPEVTVTPNENYFYNPYDNIILHQKANGGKIHIKPSKRGTFTAAAKKHGKSVQAFASQVLAHPENYSPAMRKKANFARNVSHWKHGLGGNLFYPGGYVRDKNGNPIAFDEEGNLVDQITGEKGFMLLPEVTITGRDLTKPYKSKFAFNPTNVWQSIMPQDATRLYNTSDPNRPYTPVADLINYALGYNNRKSVIQTFIDNKIPVSSSDSVFYNAPEAAFALYLGLGDKEFQTKSGTKEDKISNYFEPADYRPTKGITYDRVYKLVHPEGINTLAQEDYSIPFLNDYIFAQMVNKNKGLPTNALATSLKDVGIKSVGTEGTHAINNVTAENYTIGFGRDSKGPYISYYDEYDLNSSLSGKPKTGDIGFFISNPFSIYDRKYYNKEDSAKIMKAFEYFGEDAFDRTGKLKKEYE